MDEEKKTITEILEVFVTPAKKTHKILIKNKIFACLSQEKAENFFDLLLKSESKIKIYDEIEKKFSNPYLNDVQLLPLDDIEIIVENSNIEKLKKDKLYNIINQRTEDNKENSKKIIEDLIKSLN